MDYKRKYLKYKLKYLLLKNKKLGGLNTVPAIENSISYLINILKELFKQPDNKERNLLDLEILDKDIINTEKDINRRRKTKLLKPKTLKKQRRLLYNSDYSDSSNSSDITNSIDSSSSSED